MVYVSKNFSFTYTRDPCLRYVLTLVFNQGFQYINEYAGKLANENSLLKKKKLINTCLLCNRRTYASYTK